MTEYEKWKEEHEKWKEEMDDFIENRMATKDDLIKAGILFIGAYLFGTVLILIFALKWLF